MKRPGAEVFLQGDAGQRLPLLALQKLAPAAVEELQARAAEAERDLGQAVQVSFVFEDGDLRLEAFEPLLCSAVAALKVRVQLVGEGVLSPVQALLQTPAQVLREMLLPRLKTDSAPLASGLGNGWGAVCGQVAHDYSGCLRLLALGVPVILQVERLGYEHRDCLDLISGALISEGSSLALDQLQKPCVLTDLGDQPEGSWISLNSVGGLVFGEGLAIQPGSLSADARTLLGWADEHRRLEIRANASTAEDLRQALDWGASGVGLFRFDTLILNPRHLSLFQTCLRQLWLEGLGDSAELEQLVEQLADDCRRLFEISGPCRFNLRLLDAPVSLMLRYWKESGCLPEGLEGWLHELSPTLGLRCGRLGLLLPGLWALQMRAVLRARRAQPVDLQLMIPGVCDVRELELARQLCRQISEQEGVEMPQVGSMLEIPRACLGAGRLAEQADFLSFGTGDLSESTCGISRYDAGLSFLPEMLNQGVFEIDPFQGIDPLGVGALMEIACNQVAARRPALELGICGAQACHPASLEFCDGLGLDYVSLPARHIPVARLVAAQVRLK